MRGVMKVSAVGFLFQDKVNLNGQRGKNYTCVIHKVNPEGDYNRNVISSPIINESRLSVVSAETAQEDVFNSLSAISSNEKKSKFIGATIKDGTKETEVHSLFSDKLFAVRTRDEFGRNHFKIMRRPTTQALLAKNLYLNV